MAEKISNVLGTSHPIEDFISGESLLGIYKSLSNGNFEKMECFEFSKTGIRLLACKALITIRRAPFNF